MKKFSLSVRMNAAQCEANNRSFDGDDQKQRKGVADMMKVALQKQG